MVHLPGLIEAFKACSGPYPWRDFEKMIRMLGYEELPTGKTGGSRRKYKNPHTGHIIILHKPHGPELGAGMVRNHRKELEDRGII
ncbi:type II toxin-antitoxin system HicA family toxin [Tardiphaga sp. 768_D3_N2_1]|uniref:type II toxin-antitoxin system HicA family toxin n=1 Tax=Tardiphaga sp. 768_D3_N2_1 TaxID=3240783 RepID=UPI003F8C3B31